MSRRRHRFHSPFIAYACVFSLCPALICVPSCRRESPTPSTTGDSTGGADAKKPHNVLVFPKELHVSDAAVNAFVTTALTTSASGDYESFRLLWSARETPLPRAEFDEGWQAVDAIEVRALEEVTLDADPGAGRAAPESVYALLADVTLNPNHRAAQKEPTRHVVLMLTHENNQWRLAKAPKPMREWIKKKRELPTTNDQ